MVSFIDNGNGLRFMQSKAQEVHIYKNDPFSFTDDVEAGY